MMNVILYFVFGLVLFILFSFWDKGNANELKEDDTHEGAFWFHLILSPVALIIDIYCILRYYYKN